MAPTGSLWIWMKDKREGITPSRFRTASAGQKPNGGRNLSVHRVFLDINLTLGFIIEPIRLTNQNPNEEKDMASKVYFADFRCPTWRENLPQKLARLMMTAGFGDIDMDGKYVAIKMHFGEPGNMAYLRPNWAKTVADLVKSQGGKPFLTDCNTLYIGGRKNALDHMESAYVNGFTPYSTGCHIIIADGLKGNDEVAVPVEGGEYVKEAKIGRAVMDADVFISLTHFKGHEQAGFGGCLKNIGMGCGSRAGKMEQHNSGKPVVKQTKCVGCRA